MHNIPVDRTGPYVVDATASPAQQTEVFNQYMAAHAERQRLWRENLDEIAAERGYSRRILVGDYERGEALFFNWAGGDEPFQPEFLVAEFQVSPTAKRITRNGWTSVVIKNATGQRWSKRKLLYPTQPRHHDDYHMADKADFIYVRASA